MKTKLVVALAGNPNSGKTTLFNNLTGARQHVGNYPGVTVERKQGVCRHDGIEMLIVDLPGTYSLNACSAEEEATGKFLIDEKPDVVVDVIDASNLERNLYLAVQLMELGAPLVLAFNMSDEVRARGTQLDKDKLSAALGAPIVPTIGHKGAGMKELLSAVAAVAANGKGRQGLTVDYGVEIEAEIGDVQAALEQDGENLNGASRWRAVKLLESDRESFLRMASPELIVQVEKSAAQIEGCLNEPPETAIASRRYAFIADVCRENVHTAVEPRRTMTDAIDAVVTHRVLSLPIFMGLMYLVFQLTFTLGEPPMGWIEAFFGWLGDMVASWWPTGIESPLKSLLVDGVIGGVGGVIVFLPNILLLFLAIAILEDTGYMARAAFIMDRLMHKIGLHGKSFIPMLIGFGCSVPAIMATRTLESRRDRLATMLVTPLMSCGARLPIYALIIPAFFPAPWRAPMLWTIYVIGIILAVLAAKLLRSTILRGEATPFVMELPPYRIPTLRSVVIHMGERGWLYLKKAGTIILGISILLWAMSSYPEKMAFERDYEAEADAARAAYLAEPHKTDDAETLYLEKLKEIERQRNGEQLAYTVTGRIGRAIEPLLRPMGFDWKIGVALIGAFAAKEVFVAQMGIVYAVGEADEESEALRERLASNYTPLIAFCIMLFCLISAPCMATIAVTRRESGSWKWALLQLGGLTFLAYVLTVAVYQAGKILNIG
ncbi:MAG: ferrous iron transport protein B [Myxococcales bacterium]|nr:MAG: ferrous iron transport protein B [Myxococcales bacterium]